MIIPMRGCHAFERPVIGWIAHHYRDTRGTKGSACIVPTDDIQAIMRSLALNLMADRYVSALSGILHVHQSEFRMYHTYKGHMVRQDKYVRACAIVGESPRMHKVALSAIGAKCTTLPSSRP